MTISPPPPSPYGAAVGLRTTVVLIAASLFFLCTTTAQSHTLAAVEEGACKPMDSGTVAAAFMAALVGNDEEAITQLVLPETVIIFGRGEESERNPLYGTWTGPDGAREILRLFHEVIIPGQVDISLRHVAPDLVVMQGSMTHTIRPTGKLFASDWALIAKTCGDKVVEYSFYEDTAALEAALVAD